MELVECRGLVEELCQQGLGAILALTPNSHSFSYFGEKSASLLLWLPPTMLFPPLQTCISCFSVLTIKYKDQKQLTEETRCFSLLFQGSSVHDSGFSEVLCVLMIMALVFFAQSLDYAPPSFQPKIQLPIFSLLLFVGYNIFRLCVQQKTFLSPSTMVGGLGGYMTLGGP